MIHAVFDAQGFPSGFYVYGINENIPASAVEISEAHWREFINNQGLRRWNGKKPVVFTPRAEDVRAALPRLTRRQFKLGLLTNSITSDQILATISAMPDGMAKEVAKIEWEDATTFERGHPLVSSIGSSLGLTDHQIDTMWAAAAVL